MFSNLFWHTEIWYLFLKVHCHQSVMIFQQLSLSYNTSVSGDHHVTTWADDVDSTVTTATTTTPTTTKYYDCTSPPLSALFWLCTTLLYSTILLSPDERTGGRVGNKRRIRVRLDPAQYYADMRVSYSALFISIALDPIPRYPHSSLRRSSALYRKSLCGIMLYHIISYHATPHLACLGYSFAVNSDR